MGDVDIASKVWLKEAATDVARLILGLPNVTATDMGSVTIPSIGRIVDGLLRVERPGEAEPSWLHVELQTAWKADVPRRTFEYWSDLCGEHWPLRSWVIVLTDSDRQGPPCDTYERAVDGRPTLWFGFDVVRAWTLRREDLLAGPTTLLPLIPFCGDSSPGAVKDALARLVAGAPRTTELLAVLAVFAGYVFPTEPWLAKIPKEILMKSSTVQQLNAEAKAEGKAEGKAEVLGAMLAARLGAGFEPLEDAVKTATAEVLDAITALLIERSSDEVLLSRLRALLT